jgi:hypothetical protein
MEGPTCLGILPLREVDCTQLDGGGPGLECLECYLGDVQVLVARTTARVYNCLVTYYNFAKGGNVREVTRARGR